MEILIDNHIILLEKKKIDFIKIYFYYDNNLKCTDFLYDIKNKKFFAFSSNNFLTSRQEKILKIKIEKYIKNTDKKTLEAIKENFNNNAKKCFLED